MIIDIGEVCTREITTMTTKREKKRLNQNIGEVTHSIIGIVLKSKENTCISMYWTIGVRIFDRTKNREEGGN